MVIVRRWVVELVIQSRLWTRLQAYGLQTSEVLGALCLLSLYTSSAVMARRVATRSKGGLAGMLHAISDP